MKSRMQYVGALVVCILLFVAFLKHCAAQDGYSPSVSKDQQIPPVTEFMKLKTLDTNAKYVQQFMAYWDLEKLRVTRTEERTIAFVEKNRRPDYRTPNTNIYVTTVYGKEMTNKFSWFVVTKQYGNSPDRIDHIEVHFTMGHRPSDLALKARMLPFDLSATDTPETVRSKFGREETGLIENGNGYLDYFGALDKGISFKVTFGISKIVVCEY